MIKHTNKPLVEFKNVSIVFNGIKALDSVSFRIDAGENVAIVGPNGSGKSTLIKAIIREHYPYAGDNDSWIKLFGQKEWNVSDLRLRLGIVTGNLQQEFERGITAREAILSGFFSSIGIPPYHEATSPMKKKADELLEFLEITHLSARKMDEMSSGEARRVLIGRALVHKPDALILDEPTNSLDLHSLHTFREIMRKIARAGHSVILVTHAIQDIIPEISRVILIRDGKIVKNDKKEAILKQDVMSSFFTIPVEVKEKGGYYHVF